MADPAGAGVFTVGPTKGHSSKIQLSKFISFCSLLSHEICDPVKNIVGPISLVTSINGIKTTNPWGGNCSFIDLKMKPASRCQCCAGVLPSEVTEECVSTSMRVVESV